MSSSFNEAKSIDPSLCFFLSETGAQHVFESIPRIFILCFLYILNMEVNEIYVFINKQISYRGSEYLVCLTIMIRYSNFVCSSY